MSVTYFPINAVNLLKSLYTPMYYVYFISLESRDRSDIIIVGANYYQKYLITITLGEIRIVTRCAAWDSRLRVHRE